MPALQRAGLGIGPGLPLHPRRARRRRMDRKRPEGLDSIAQLSTFGMLLARSDPDVPKHEGLSYFIMDMKAPGVDIRPLRQLTGSSEFNEVFLTDVKNSRCEPSR